jgi:hypothetical protein
VPIDAIRVALAAASEKTDLVVLDPTSVTEFVIRRPALWAIAQEQSWRPSYLDGDVERAMSDAAASEPAVRAVTLAPGDPESHLAGPELVVQLALEPGLDSAGLTSLMERLQKNWAASEVVATRVDSMRVQLITAS